MLRDKEVQSLFEDYYFDRQQVDHKKNLSTTTTYSINSYSSSNFSWIYYSHYFQLILHCFFNFTVFIIFNYWISF